MIKHQKISNQTNTNLLEYQPPSTAKNFLCLPDNCWCSRKILRRRLSKNRSSKSHFLQRLMGTKTTLHHLYPPKVYHETWKNLNGFFEFGKSPLTGYQDIFFHVPSKIHPQLWCEFLWGWWFENPKQCTFKWGECLKNCQTPFFPSSLIYPPKKKWSPI